MKTKILNRLQEQLDYVKYLGYSEDRIVGIFLYGSQNYGFATEESDIDSKVIVLPSFEDLCLKHQWVSTTVHMENGECIDIKDIRAMKDNWTKQNINFMELLYTEYCIINPKYEELFKNYFINNREIFANLDKCRGMQSIAHQMIDTLKQDMTDNKKLYNGERLCYFLERWAAGAPYEECLRPSGDIAKLMMDIKTGNIDWNENKKIQKAEEYIAQGNLYIELAEQYEFNAEALNLLNKGVVEILKFSFEEPTTAALSKEEFFEHLTNLEEKAYHAIVQEIGAEGTIVVSKLVKDTIISRPVYNNLFEKLRRYNIAETINMGVKGMHIKIIHPVLKAEAERP